MSLLLERSPLLKQRGLESLQLRVACEEKSALQQCNDVIVLGVELDKQVMLSDDSGI